MHAPLLSHSYADEVASVWRSVVERGRCFNTFCCEEPNVLGKPYCRILYIMLRRIACGGTIETSPNLLTRPKLIREWRLNIAEALPPVSSYYDSFGVTLAWLIQGGTSLIRTMKKLYEWHTKFYPIKFLNKYFDNGIFSNQSKNIYNRNRCIHIIRIVSLIGCMRTENQLNILHVVKV